MSRRIHAQLIQLTRAKFGWVILAVCFAALALIFMQFAGNSHSNVFASDSRNPATVAAVFLVMTTFMLGMLPGITIGCYLGVKDVDFRTASNLAQSGGRLPSAAAKVGVLALVSAGIVVAISLLGVVAGLAVANGPQPPLMHLGAQMGITFGVLFMTGLLALTVAMLTRNLAVANIVCFLAMLSGLFVPGPVGRALAWASPFSYFQGLMYDSFGELAAIPNVSLGTEFVAASQSLPWGLLALCLEAGLIGMVSLKQEVRS